MLGIPCGDSYPTCKFIRDANVSVASQDLIEGDLRFATTQLIKLDPTDIYHRIEEYRNIQSAIVQTEKEISELSLARERNKGLKVTHETKLATVEAKIEEYESNKEAIENLERLLQTRSGS